MSEEEKPEAEHEPSARTETSDETSDEVKKAPRGNVHSEADDGPVAAMPKPLPN